MDLSKLPKLSQTPAPADNAAPVAPGDAPGAPAKVELFCRCGAPITPGTNFCSNCGANYYQAMGGRGRRDQVAPAIGTGAEAWLSFAMAVILLFLAPRIWQFYLFPSHFTWTFNDAQGAPMAYPHTEFFWADLGLAAFSVVLFLEGIAILLFRSTPILIIALLLTLAATALNIYVIARTYNLLGFQIINALAAAFGVYIAICEFAQLRAMSPSARRSDQ
jgi:hypothetical protein